MDGKDQLVRFGSGPVVICSSGQYISERDLEILEKNLVFLLAEKFWA